MHLPSKLKSKYVAVFLLFIFLFIPPFKNLVSNIFVYFSRQLLFVPQKYLERVKDLERENLTLLLELKRVAGLETENEKLRKALEFKEESSLKLIPAGVIFFDPSSWRRIVIVDKGKASGVTIGAFAINEQGWLLGRITGFEGDRAQLMLINDPDFTVPVFVGSSFAAPEISSGLFAGGIGAAKVLYLERESPLAAGDKVWVKVPPLEAPIYIGEIKRLREDRNSLFWDVEVGLFCHNPLLDKIFIVR